MPLPSEPTFFSTIHSDVLCGFVYQHNKCDSRSCHTGISMCRYGSVPLSSGQAMGVDIAKTKHFLNKLEYKCSSCHNLFLPHELDKYFMGFGKSKEKNGFICTNCKDTPNAKQVTKGYSNDLPASDAIMYSQSHKVKGWCLCSECDEYSEIPLMKKTQNIYCLDCDKYFCNDCVHPNTKIREPSDKPFDSFNSSDSENDSSFFEENDEECESEFSEDNDDSGNDLSPKRFNQKSSSPPPKKPKLSKEERVQRIQQGKAASKAKRDSLNEMKKREHEKYIQNIKDVIAKAGIDLDTKTKGKYFITEDQKEILDEGFKELLDKYLSKINVSVYMDDTADAAEKVEKQGPSSFMNNIQVFAKKIQEAHRILQLIKKNSGINFVIKAYTGKYAKGFSSRKTDKMMGSDGEDEEYEEEEVATKPCEKCKGTGTTTCCGKRKRGRQQAHNITEKNNVSPVVSPVPSASATSDNEMVKTEEQATSSVNQDTDNTVAALLDLTGSDDEQN